jgi:hypothetical protein
MERHLEKCSAENWKQRKASLFWNPGIKLIPRDEAKRRLTRNTV